MAQLRPVSARPELLVGDDGARIESPSLTQVGLAGPLGRERVVFAVATNDSGPVLLAPYDAALQGDGALVADPSGNVVGTSGAVWVHRMLYAGKVADTRRLG